MSQGRYGRGHEPSDVRMSTILWVALIIASVLAAVLALLWPWHREPAVARPPSVVGPSLLPNPIADLAAYRAEKARRLGGYGWVDQKAGIAHIPVERAIEILTQRAAEKPEETSP